MIHQNHPPASSPCMLPHCQPVQQDKPIAGTMTPSFPSSPPLHQQSIQQDVPIAGMMTGISEMTLPLEQRLKRIEETEIAKRGMLAAASKRYGAWYGVGILTFL